MTKILVLEDDLWHPAEVIERGFASFPASDYAWDFVRTAKDILTPEMMKEYPVIINCKSNNVNAANTEPWFEDGVTEVGPDEFRKYMEDGGNMLILHSGNAFWAEERFPKKEEKFTRPNRAYRELVGNTFTGHPLRCHVTVHVTNPEHPVMKGVHDFAERDEHYQCDITAEDAEPLLETVSEPGGRRVGGYVRKIGKGKLIAVFPGHTLAVWQNPEYQKIILNALDWCLGRKV